MEVVGGARRSEAEGLGYTVTDPASVFITHLTQVLKLTGGNVTQAAKLAQRNRTDFYALLGRHQIDPAAFKV